MRLRRLFCAWILVPLVLLGLPLHAAAHFTLTGQFVEQLPGGGSPDYSYVWLDRVSATGSRSSVTSAKNCEGAATMNCIQPDGKLTILDLQPGLYLLFYQATTHGKKVFNVSISGTTDIVSSHWFVRRSTST